MRIIVSSLFASLLFLFSPSLILKVLLLIPFVVPVMFSRVLNLINVMSLLRLVPVWIKIISLFMVWLIFMRLTQSDFIASLFCEPFFVNSPESKVMDYVHGLRPF